MINACSVNVTDLAIFRRKQGGQGGDGTDTAIARGLRAHHEPTKATGVSVGGRDLIVTNTLLIDGFDSEGEVVKIKPFDLAQWTDWAGELTKKLEIARVSPHSEPGKGEGISGIAHVRLDVG